MSRCQQLSRQRLKVCIIMWDFIICVCVVHWYVSETTMSIVYGPVSSEIRDWPNTWCLCHYACAQIIIISTSCILGFGVQMYMFCTKGYLCNAVHFIIFAIRSHLQWKKNPKYGRPHAFCRPHVFCLTPVQLVSRCLVCMYTHA